MFPILPFILAGVDVVGEAGLNSLIKPLLLAAVLCLPAAAQELTREERTETGAAAQKAREQVDMLPEAARIELKKMYRRYVAAVAKRRESGWDVGVINEAVIEDVDEPFQPARLVDDMLEQRRKEIARYEAAFAKAEGDDPIGTKRLRRTIESKKEELATLRSRSRGEKGLCRDWSDAVWFELRGMDLQHWEVKDQRRTARPYHTGAVACAPVDDPAVCLVFDPWKDGRPSVFAFRAWDENADGGRFPADYFLHELPEKPRDK